MFIFIFKFVIHLFRNIVESTDNKKKDVKKNQVKDKKQGKKDKYVLRTYEYISFRIVFFLTIIFNYYLTFLMSN